MNRIKIELPDLFSFSTLITIRLSDLNYGGHVGNDRFLSLMQEARQQFLLSFGYAELSIEGFGLIMADAAIQFTKELMYNDMVKISLAANSFDKLGFDLIYKIEVLKDSEWTLAGKAKTGMICYDYTKKNKVPIPPAVVSRLQS